MKMMTSDQLYEMLKQAFELGAQVNFCPVHSTDMDANELDEYYSRLRQLADSQSLHS